jgi:hypothetical protein
MLHTQENEHGNLSTMFLPQGGNTPSAGAATACSTSLAKVLGRPCIRLHVHFVAETHNNTITCPGQGCELVGVDSVEIGAKHDAARFHHSVIPSPWVIGTHSMSTQFYFDALTHSADVSIRSLESLFSQLGIHTT